VLMLTTLGATESKVLGLNAGADDYTVVDPVLPSLWYDGCCSLGPRSHGEHRPLFLGGGTDRP
jgi:hypothetical protein